MSKFTLEAVEWKAWLPTVDAATATPEQLAALDKSPPQSRTSPYFLTLALDVDALEQRSPLFNAVMYAPRGLRRADRELATVIVSMINGCVYCSSVHARRFAELTKQPEVIQHLYDDGLDTPLEPRLRAIVDFAAKLTRTPEAMVAADLVPLRAAGLEDADIHDLIHATAMFANANRLMQTLGEPVMPEGTA
jgi:uncharacterized peroxidase-related enzyme